LSMSRTNTWNEPFLPWVQSENDRRFLRILLVCVIVFSIFGAIVPFLPTSEPEKKDLKTVSPRLARLIMEKRKLPPPPIPKPVKPKAKPKPEVKKKPKAKQKKPLKKPVKRKLNKKQQVAKKAAASTGLMTMTDELSDLRDSFDISEFDDQPLSKAGKTKPKDFSAPAVISSRTAMKSSGGIKSSQLGKSTGGGKLASRSTTKVRSNIDTGTAKKTVKRGKSGRAIRPEYEIEQVFQKNKSAIYGIYNRALRKDPTLQGKVVIELTIAPNGKVVKARILSSELNNPKLERKLLARVKLFRFKPSNSEQVTVRYPIDFLPS